MGDRSDFLHSSMNIYDKVAEESKRPKGLF